MGKAVYRDAPHPRALGRPLAGRGGGRLSRKGDRVSERHGGSRPLWRALPEVWRKNPADSLCGQRNELLCSMPNWWQSSRGSWFVQAIAIGLAADARRTRGLQAPLGNHLSPPFIDWLFREEIPRRTPLTLNQTCARPPSTNTSLPVIKLLSSEARNKAAAAVSSGLPTRSSGAWLARSARSASCIPVFASPLRRPGVVVAPGESTLTRMPVPFRSSGQLPPTFRIAAFVALYTLKAGVPMEPVVDPMRMMEPPARINESAFCTVNRVPLTFTSKTLSNCSSLIAPKGFLLPIPALANSTSTCPFSACTVANSRSRSSRFEMSP